MSRGRVFVLLGFVAILLTFGWDISFGISSFCRIDGAKVLIIVGDGFDWVEYIGVKNNLTDEGALVLTASYEKEELCGHYGEGPIIPDLTLTEVNVSEYDAFYIPGGLSPEALLTDSRSETLLDLVREANDEHLILSAICHGPWVLANASVVEGKNGTAHPEVEQYWTAAGGIWAYPKIVERDENLLTARYEGLEEFKEALVLAVHMADTEPPIISVPSHVPQEPTPNQEVKVTVNATDHMSRVRGVILSYSNGIIWTNVTMTWVAENTYTANITAMPYQTHVEYKIVVYDNFNNTAVEDNLGLFYTYVVIPEFPSVIIFTTTLISATLIAVIFAKKTKRQHMTRIPEK